MREAGSGVPHRRRPCAQCPWRRDVAPGMFGRDRFDALAATCGGPGREVEVGVVRAPDDARHPAVALGVAVAGDEGVADEDDADVTRAVVHHRLRARSEVGRDIGIVRVLLRVLVAPVAVIAHA